MVWGSTVTKELVPRDGEPLWFGIQDIHVGWKSSSLQFLSMSGGEGGAKGRWDRMQSEAMGEGKAACAFNFCSPGFRNVALLGMLL